MDNRGTHPAMAVAAKLETTLNQAAALACLVVLGSISMFACNQAGLPQEASFAAICCAGALIFLLTILSTRSPIAGFSLIVLVLAALVAGFLAGTLLTERLWFQSNVSVAAAPIPTLRTTVSRLAPLTYLQKLAKMIGDDQPAGSPLEIAHNQLVEGSLNGAIAALGSAQSRDQRAIFALLVTQVGEIDTAVSALKRAVDSTPSTDRLAFAARMGELFEQQWQDNSSVAALTLAVVAREAALQASLGADTTVQRITLATSILALEAVSKTSKQAGMLARANTLLSEGLDNLALSTEDRRKAQLLHGKTLRRMGQVFQDVDALMLAVGKFQGVLDEFENALPQTQFGIILNELGLAERWLGSLSKNEPMLARAVDHYLSSRLALNAVGNESAAAVVSANLLIAIGQLNTAKVPALTPQVRLAIADDALTTVHKEVDPRRWGRIQIERGNLLFAAGNERLQADVLQQSVEALTAGLEGAQTDGRTPWEWAVAENQLANALQALGQAQNDADTMRKALKARNNAWVLYQYAGMDNYQFYFEDRIASLENLLAEIDGTALSQSIEEEVDEP